MGAQFIYEKEHATPEVFIRTYKGDDDEEISSLLGVWEIEHLKDDKRGDDFCIEQFDEDSELGKASVKVV